MRTRTAASAEGRAGEQQVLLPGVVGQGRRAAQLVAGLGVAPEPAQQVGADRVQQVVVVQPDDGVEPLGLCESAERHANLGLLYAFLDRKEDALREGRRAVELKPVKPLKKSVTLEQIKAEPKLREIALLRNSRLSVQPLGKAEFELICRL